MSRLPDQAETAGLVDSEGLARFLEEKLPDHSGPFEIERLGQGQANLTFLIRGEGWELVLRRPPRGDLPPTAFDVTREYRVMRALHDHRAPVPVPAPLELCKDQEVIGAPFYLMDRVDGHVVRTELPTELSSLEDRGQMAHQLADTLAELHSLDYREIGLEGFGKPAGYLGRQLRRMNQLWELARFREIPEIDQTAAWLSDNLPAESRHTVVHGDYKLDNVIFAPAAPARLIAVVDWEMSTLGDPLADLGWMLYFWREPGDPELGLAASTVTHLEGFPRRGQIMSRYSTRTKADTSRILWYVALAGWKIAIIMEGSYRRFKAGITDHPAFEALEEAVPALARRAALAARGEFEI
ncbi:MAG: phosphotransferase family protein [Actinomycetota bacterium]